METTMNENGRADAEAAALRRKLEAGVATARKAVGNSASKLRSTATDTMKAGDDYVRERPWQAVGIAAAAGLLAGYLVGRR